MSRRLPRCGNERGKQTQGVRFTRTAEVHGRSGEFASRRESWPSFARHGRATVPPQTGPSHTISSTNYCIFFCRTTVRSALQVVEGSTKAVPARSALAAWKARPSLVRAGRPVKRALPSTLVPTSRSIL